MLNINKLAEVATGKVTLLQCDRITVVHGATSVDIDASGQAIYGDHDHYLDLGIVTQERAVELVQGGTV